MYLEGDGKVTAEKPQEIGIGMPYDKALDVPWHAYRAWAATARFLKGDLNRWTRLTLWLAIAGAVLAAASQELGVFKVLAKSAAILASFAVALSAYFGKEALSGNKAADWIRARSAAESLKAATYLYRAGTPPFNAVDREKILFEQVAVIEQTVTAVQTRSAAQETTVPDLSPMTVDEYIVKRLDEQTGFYDQRAGEYQSRNDTLRNATLGLGATSVLLGLMAAAGAVPALVGLIATLTASLSAHAKNQQYQTLIVMYQSTSRRLVALKGEWIASHNKDADTDARNAFIRSCEDALALENSAWVGEWSPKRPAAARG